MQITYKGCCIRQICKAYVKEVMEPIDDLFLEIGNQFINLCNGFTNDDAYASLLSQRIEDV